MSVVLVDCLLTAGNRERLLALRINVRGMLIGMAGDVCSSPEANKLASYNEKKRGAEEQEFQHKWFRRETRARNASVI